MRIIQYNLRYFSYLYRYVIYKYNMEIIKIDQLQTEGHDIAGLVSTQFVKKVLALIDAGDFQLILSKPKK